MLAKYGQKSIIIVMFVDQEMRRKTKQSLKGELDIPLPMIPSGELEPDELREFLEAVKPLQYVALARVIDPIIERVTSTPLTPSASKVGFDGLSYESQGCFSVAIDEVKGSDVYQEAAEYPKVISRFDPGKYSRLDTQLKGGSGNATNTILNLLEDLPKIIAHHAPEAELSVAELAAVAKRSGRLVWRNAMMGSDKMVALHSVMSLDNWLEEPDTDKAGNPMDSYQVIFDEDGEIHSIDFANIEEVVIPKGYRYRDYEPLENNTALKDFDFHKRAAIGCPITLLAGRMDELWQWYIRAAVDTGCWKK